MSRNKVEVSKNVLNSHLDAASFAAAAAGGGTDRVRYRTRRGIPRRVSQFCDRLLSASALIAPAGHRTCTAFRVMHMLLHAWTAHADAAVDIKHRSCCLKHMMSPPLPNATRVCTAVNTAVHVQQSAQHLTAASGPQQWAPQRRLRREGLGWPRGEEVRPHRHSFKNTSKEAHTAPIGQNRTFALQAGQKNGMRVARCHGLRGRAHTPTCQMLISVTLPGIYP